MRILIHTDEYYPTAQACSYRMRTLADAFIDQGDEVVVIASSPNKGNGKMLNESAKVRVVTGDSKFRKPLTIGDKYDDELNSMINELINI